VPNSKFLEQNVINWSYTNVTRITIPIGVAYSTDLLKARDILIDLTKRHELILKSPEPTVFCDSFDDSSIKLSLAFWIGEQARHRRIKSDMNYLIKKAFDEHKIEIPFPQRVVTHINARPNLGRE
jgi:small-conductance mechanosensitive channel